MTDKNAVASDREKRKDKYSQQSLDTSVFERLEVIVTKLQDTDNYKPLIEFCQKGFLSQIVQAWSYYAQVNNHAMFSKSTITLMKTLRTLEGNPGTVAHGGNLIKLILTDYSKVLYRGLNNCRGQITNPILYLMKSMILYEDSKYVEDFLAFFDFSLPVLPRILTPSKSELEKKESKHKPLRLSFIEFWITLVKKTPSLLRKDLLSDNYKIMGAWFKYMDKVDSTEIMISTISMFIESILQEKILKRTSKIKILNELALTKIHTFYYSGDKNLVTKVNDFFVAYGFDSESSVTFPDYCVWFDESPIAGMNTSVPIMVNQREFKIYNKVLFNALRLFKPWEDDLQSSTVVKFLKHTPELVAPYCAYLTSLGSHSPRITSYWFGMTLLLGRIINLPIPSFMENAETDMTPSPMLVLESIIPSSLSKASLTKALQSDSILIKQMACQLLVFTFKKLELVLDLYERKGWSSAKSTINNPFLTNIPDLQTIITTLNQVYTTNKSNKVIALSLTLTMEYYGRCFPNFFSVTLPSSNIYVDIMEESSFSGIDLAILDSFLQYQEYNNTQTKWWNSLDGRNSLFTSLLKLASSSNTNTVVSNKISKLFDGLLHGSVIFKNDLLASPIMTLISSLQCVSKESNQEPASLNPIWNLLDQSIARCIKTPYKYVTLAESYGNISPFIMALMEQWKFVEKSNTIRYTLAAKWLCIYLRSLGISGEAPSCLKDVAGNCLDDIPFDLLDRYLDFSSNETNLKTLNEEKFLMSQNVEMSFFYYITLLPYSEMKTVSRLPINDLDVAGGIFRILSITNDDQIKSNKDFQGVILALFEQIARYVLTNVSYKLITPQIYKRFFCMISTASNKDTEGKIIFATQQLLLIFRESINYEKTELESFLLEWLANTPAKMLDDTYLDFLGLVVEFLTPQRALNLLEKGLPFSAKLIGVLLSRVANDKELLVDFAFVQEYLSFGDSGSTSITLSLITNGQVANFSQAVFLSKILSDANYLPVLEAYLDSKYFSFVHVNDYLKKITNDEILITVASGISEKKEIDSSVGKFIQTVLDDCLNKYRELKEKDFQRFLSLLIVNTDVLLADQLENVLKYAITEYNHKFCANVIELVAKVGNFETDCTIKWLNKMALYVTKIFSERAQLSDALSKVLCAFERLICTIDVWDVVNHNIINSQLEVIFGSHWINDERVMKYALLLTLKGNKSRTHCEKMIQLMLNNEAALINKNCSGRYLTYLIVVCLATLFRMDPHACSTSIIQSKILSYYSGTISASDKILFQILEAIESENSVSWTNMVYTWDVLGNGDETLDFNEDVKLLTQEKEGFILTLREDYIENSIRNYVIDRRKPPRLAEANTNIEIWDKYSAFFDNSEVTLKTTNNKPVYDPLFLMLIIPHNKELVNYSKGEDNEITHSLNVKNLVQAKLLHVIICSLGDKDAQTVKVALIMLSEALKSLDANLQFKDGNIFRILLKKILFTHDQMESNKDVYQHKVTPLMWFFVTAVTELLTQPADPLYEKAFRWILSGPLVRPNDIPLFQELISPKHSDADYEVYYRQLSWLLETFESSIKCEDDLNLLKSKGFVDWLLNLLQVPYLNARLVSLINQIIYRCQRIENGGPTLITRFGGISNLEMSFISDKDRLSQAESRLVKNDKNPRNQKFKCILEEKLLNTKELLAGYTEIVNSRKRLRDWTENDSSNIAKRFCGSSIQ
ncbi:Urb1p KNAG_0M02440 [Huiozyma naganishii CBS 8797]|uniref:Nucleolar pre-ribosomal-associated protein 1 C-terminal domain-containing protein n=1 Tax=Huiozyma naganishii (strain ATCC MYA-139 / BCRC 22969 / CBS 8797 / KCTC 17520 / NBRC 10181 / NCYC 3082 / Yp74L-3) TaxID=1071383 RepID=J7S4A8_HUIN7|nr:hypothetical protein KNAG_0M02440 [Kazachstania naganishii CBS 8797]CCK73097.1 hypothetical protein KNAG_0M02440 [Kazachstania naganishii CBS 8797]